MAVELPLWPLPSDEGMRAEMELARAAHAIPPRRRPPPLHDSGSTLPPEPRAGALPYVGALNEWYALLECIELLRPLPPGPTSAALSAALAALCHVPADVPRAPHPHASSAAAAADELECELRGVRVAACPASGGRGVASTRPLRAGERVVAVPAGALLCAAAARASPLAAVLPELREGAWDETLAVMLLLLHERRRGRASRWWRYLRLLPREFENTSSWTHAQIESLGGGATYWRARGAREEVLAIRAALLPRLRRLAPQLFPAHAYGEAEWLWARAVVETRAIALPSGPQAGAVVVAPLLDMVNHSQAPQLKVVADGAGGLCLEAQVDVAAHTELSICYGALDADDLLLHHGVVLADDAARRAAPPARTPPPLRVAVALQPPARLEAAEGGALLSSVLLLTHHLRLPLDGALVRGAAADGAALPPRLLGSARMLSIGGGEELRRLPVARADSAPLSESNEAAALRLLEEACEEAVAALCGEGEEEEGTGRKRRRGGARVQKGRELCAQQRRLYERALREIRTLQAAC
ncbi:hypothetical protein AB1Y20_007185 [Prymnesium parvum]|uniref:SET domain-containing protein n=1 Tax=Prymnesium parvum TaxID=97485 RepID=A0AB34IUF8_PRYPA